MGDATKPMADLNLNPTPAAPMNIITTPRKMSFLGRRLKGDIHTAAEAGKLEDVKQFLEKAGADQVNALNKDQDTPLHLAAISGHHDTVKLLVQKGGNVNAINCRGNTPLHLAGFGGHWYIADLLLGAGAEIDARNEWNDTPVLLACCAGESRMVEYLVQKGADCNIASGDGKTPAMLAKQEGHSDIVAILEKAAQAKASGLTLEVAKLPKNPPGATDTARGSHVVKRRNSFARKYKGTIHTAAEKGKLKIVREWLESGEVDVNALNDDDDTPLHLCSLLGHDEVALALLEKGGDYTSHNKSGNTPLHLASYMGHIKIVEMLLRAGADINSLNKQNDTPLLLACLGGHAAMVAFLLRLGADLSIASASGKTPKMLAQEHNQKQVLEMLEAYDVYMSNQKDQATPQFSQ